MPNGLPISFPRRLIPRWGSGGSSSPEPAAPRRADAAGARCPRARSRLVAGGRSLGAFVGGTPAAAAAFPGMRQWWRGRPVPMAGVSSVKVAPEYRGRGIGRRLMTALLDEIAARGYPLSALFPA